MKLKMLFLLLALMSSGSLNACIKVRIEKGFIAENNWQKTDWLSWVSVIQGYLCTYEGCLPSKENVFRIANETQCIHDQEREMMSEFLDRIEAFILFDRKNKTFYCLKNNHRFDLFLTTEQEVIIDIDLHNRKTIKSYLRKADCWDKYFGKFLTLNMCSIEGIGVQSCIYDKATETKENFGFLYDKFKKKLEKKYPEVRKSSPCLPQISRLSSPANFLKKSKSRDFLNKEAATETVNEEQPHLHSLKRSRSAFGFKRNSRNNLDI